MRKVLLISNRVMHYRVSLYNYFARSFRNLGWEFLVRANQLQSSSKIEIKFDFKEIPFQIGNYILEIRKIKPDAVILFLHVRDEPIIWFLVHYLKLSGIPVAFWTKGANLDNPADRLSRLCYRYLHSVFDSLILYSSSEIKLINQKFRNKIFIANNTLNFNDFPVVKESKEHIKRTLHIPFKKVVLFVGRMGIGNDRKKPEHLIEIFRNCDRKDVGLVIVGSGLSENLKKRINSANTIYMGEVHDPSQYAISRIFKMADLFSIPGHIGLGINQAFFFGLPVVTEDGGQPPEINYLKNNENGFLVPHNDIDGLKEKIFYLLDNDKIRKEFSRNARKDILMNGSVEKMFTGFYRCVQYMTN